MRELVLVTMPFADRCRPSFALSQLSALVRRDLGERYDVRVHYLNHDFVRFLGADLYDAVTEDLAGHIAGVGDWFFRAVAFPDEPDNAQEYFARYFAGADQAGLRDALERRRERLYGFCEAVCHEYGLADADVVGFSSMFAQTVPSLAMAQIIKERNPDVVTVMGGANCEAPMGATLAANTEPVDFFFSGPALRTFPQFLRAVADEDPESAHGIRGVVSRRNCTDPKYRSAIGPDRDIDDYLEPDYEPFIESFDRMAADTGERDGLAPILFFETSRGCWWGERAHCTFCGLNGQNMGYRAMAPELAVRLFERLFEHAPWCTRFTCTDNILPMEYLTEVFPRLSPPEGVSVFYEVKVGLDREDMSVLARAGVTEIQPGIEALNTHTLKLMRKGTSVFQNVQLLKNCVRYGINPSWNLLIGFPGEPESTYEKYAADLPLLRHLPPPDGCFPVRFDRYSPYFNDAEQYGLDLQPVDHYRLTYPFPAGDLADLAYYFADRSLADYQVAAAQWSRKLDGMVRSWALNWSALPEQRPVLTAQFDADGAQVLDTRSGATRSYRLDAAEAAVLGHLDRPSRLDRLGAELPQVPDPLARVAALRERGLLIEEGGRAMSLALSDGEADPMPRPRRTVVGARRALPLVSDVRGPARPDDLE
ncbi:RiPP maturation radical SAM C-methyltransferase [Actinocrinis puniceicyclus]|uniref:RiPP maturation radical SAM C-methyltransferase n=1 Tax=Actinocrinis puniceicyclus TaxID=977794 RepID=A0A8J7WKW1_9ACTN|nr:RiPP maturation radical SAM C-methyltransferase [Actinocrinis puniceicyclus]MBS2964181.1 RiPP maturation radical SAM C-methyltransferase [Actinocrinis puniceicyclus]